MHCSLFKLGMIPLGVLLVTCIQGPVFGSHLSGSVTEKIALIQNIGLSQERVSIPMLLDSLDDESYQVRACAAWALGELKYTKAADTLLQLLNDTAFDVRMNAAISLGEFGDTRAVNALIKVLKTTIAESDRKMLIDKSSDYNSMKNYPPSVVERIIDILPFLGKPAISALAEQTTDQNMLVRLACSIALGKFALYRLQASTALLPLLSDHDASIQLATIVSLGRLGNSQATPALIVFLSNDNKSTRVAAINALGNIRDHRAVAPLLNLLLHSSTDELSSIYSATINVTTSADVPLLISEYNKATDRQKTRLLNLLILLPQDDRISNLLLPAFQNNNIMIKCLAIEGFRKYPTEKFLSLLRETYNNVNITNLEKYSLFEALEIYEDQNLINSQLKYLNYEATISRANSTIDDIDELQVLGRIGYSAVPILGDMLNSPTLPYKRGICHVFQNLHDSRAIPYLSRLLTTENTEDIRIAGIRAIGAIHDSSALQFLRPLLTDTNQNVRMAAIDNIYKLGDISMIMDQISTWDHQSLMTKLSVISSLRFHPDSHSCNYLYSLYDRSDSLLQKDILQGMAENANDEVLELLSRLIPETDLPQAIDLITALQYNHNTKTVDLLIPYVNCSSPYLRNASIYTLIKMRNSIRSPEQKIETVLLSALEHEDSNENDLLLIEALGYYGDSKAIQYLHNRLKSSSVEQKSVIMSLASLKDSSVLPILLSGLQQHDNPSIIDALRLLRKFGGRQETNAVLELLDNGTCSLQVEALTTLAIIGSPDILPRIHKYTKSPFHAVRENAALTIGELGKIADLPVIAPLTNDPWPTVRLAAAEALGKLKGEASVKVLLAAIEHETDRRIKVMIASSLEKQNSRIAIPELISLLDDSNDDVRRQAVTALQKITRQKIGDDYTKWQEWRKTYHK